jgi:hypothetical protein
MLARIISSRTGSTSANSTITAPLRDEAGREIVRFDELFDIASPDHKLVMNRHGNGSKGCREHRGTGARHGPNEPLVANHF